MARIRDAKVKETSGGYRRLFGIPALGDLISSVQSTVISSGNELERIVLAQVEQIENLDEFLKLEIMPDGVQVATKTQIKKCKSLKFTSAEPDFPSAEPDFIIFKRRKGEQCCHVVELKDGHLFDTKKASAEQRAIHSFIERTAQHLRYCMSAHFCCFNQDSRDAIVTGFKNKITHEEAMTGQEFCGLLEIDYNTIVSDRQRAQPENVQYFLQELVGIDQVRAILQKLLRNG